MMDVKELLKALMKIPAPSGYEGEMAAEMKRQFAPYCDDVRGDRAGNVIGKIAGRDPAVPVTMLFGHMDSVGFIVRRVEPDGYVQLDRLGGIPEKALPGQRLLIRTEDGQWRLGVIGMKAHHATPAEEKYKVDLITDLFVDLGAKSAVEVHEMGVFVGCPAVYYPTADEISGGRVTGTSVDNRGACACLLRIAELLKTERPAGDVYLVGTVWEEFNLRGAMLAARTVKPDIAISLDVSLAADTPDLARRFEVKMGEGPSVHLFSFHGRGTLNGTIAHEPLFKHAKKAAQALGVPLQRFASQGILTDAAYIQLEGDGVATLEMGFPARYTHTPVEVCDPADIEGLARVAAGMMQGLTSDFKLNRF